MSYTGGDGGDGPPSPEMTADDPLATLLGPEVADIDQTADDDDVQPPQPSASSDQNQGGGGTQDTNAPEQPQQENVQGTEAVRTQSRDSTSVTTPSSAGAVPATPSRGGFMSGLTRMFGGRRASSATADSSGNVPPTSNESTASGSRPASLVEQREPQTPRPQTPEPQVPELIGPSRRRLGSQGSGSQGSAGSSPGRGGSGPRGTRADTGLSVETDVADLEARGENTPTPIGTRNRPNPFGPRSAGGVGGGSLSNSPRDDRELKRRNRAFTGIFDQMRYHQVTDDWVKYQEHYDEANQWDFQLGVDTLDLIQGEAIAKMRDVLDEAGDKVPDDIKRQIIAQTQRSTEAARERVLNGLIDERVYIENTAQHIVDLMQKSPTTPRRRRGTSRASGTSSFDSRASQPELNPLSPEALRKAPREDLVNRVLRLEQSRQEAVDAATEAEDRAHESDTVLRNELEKVRVEANKKGFEDQRIINALERENSEYSKLVEAGPSTAPPRQGPARQSPTEDSPEEYPPAAPSRSRAGSPPRSPAREQTFADLTRLLGNLARHEGLVRQLQANAGLNPEGLEARTAPFSENSQLSRTQLLLQLRHVTENRDELERERERLAEQVARLEEARVSPPSRPGTGFFDKIFGGTRDGESSGSDSRSRSGSRVDPARPLQTIADDPQEQGSRQSPGSRRQSEAGSRHSGASGNRSAGSRRQSEAGSRQRDGSSSNSAASATPPEAGGGQSEAGSRHSDAGSRHSDAGSRHSDAGSGQSEAGSGQSGGSSGQSGGSRRGSNAPGGEPGDAYPAPLRALPEWLATHPNGPCRDCVPVFRFPPELGELPTCGCTCDLALGNPPRSAGGSSGAGSSRSRASSGRSVRFAEDGAGADENNGRRRPDPLNLAALGLVDVSDDDDDDDRPTTPYPAGAEGGQPDAPANAPADGPAGNQNEAPAPGAEIETVPIQPPEEEGPAVEEPVVVEPAVLAPAIAAPGGRRGGRCPCCGRGAYGVPPAGGVPQVAFYTCRNMAGQPAAAPVTFANGLRNILAAAAAAAGLNGPRRAGTADAPPVPGPADPEGGDGPAAPGAPVPEAAPRDRVMTFLTLCWNLIIFTPLLWVRNFWGLLLSLFSWMAQWGVYLNLRYVAGQNVTLPTILTRSSMLKIGLFAMFVMFMWLVTLAIALIEERRIWKAANPQMTAPYFRGTLLRRPYPFWPVFEADSGLIRPALGTYSQTIRGWYFS